MKRDRPSTKTPLARFKQQRAAAAQRGIEWLLTFEDWKAIWDASGHFPQRGCRAGQYVMGRHGDVGPYSKDNVYICLFAQNVADAFRFDPNKHPGLVRLGEGRGWTLKSRGKKRYQVVLSRKYIGVFATAAEAEAAYLHAASEFRVSHGLHLCPAEPLNTTQQSRGSL